jgi:hypothetical protein
MLRYKQKWDTKYFKDTHLDKFVYIKKQAPQEYTDNINTKKIQNHLNHRLDSLF